MAEPDDPIERSLARAERGESGETLRDARREFGAAGTVARPFDRPQDGRTLIERALTRFRTRDDSRRAHR